MPRFSSSTEVARYIIKRQFDVNCFNFSSDSSLLWGYISPPAAPFIYSCALSTTGHVVLLSRQKDRGRVRGARGGDVAADDRHKGRGQEAIDETSHLHGRWLPDGEIFYSLPYSVVKFKPSILVGPPSRGLGLNLMGAM